jgi:hypothetical protein
VANELDGDIFIESTPEKNIKRAVFLLNFYVHSDKRKQGISGRAKSTVTVRKVNNTLRIIDEKQEVLSRARHE